MADPSRWEVPADRLEIRFRDKSPPLSWTEALREATRCLYCFEAPCIGACPTTIDIPTFIRKIATGNLRGAARTILSANLLGASCARVCPVEVLCEGACVYAADGRPAHPCLFPLTALRRPLEVIDRVYRDARVVRAAHAAAA